MRFRSGADIITARWIWSYWQTGKELGDGAGTIFLSTRGKNPDEVSEELVSFLEFVRAGQDGNSEVFEDTYVTRLQNTIRQIKENRGKERQYMMWQDLIDDAKVARKAARIC